METICKHNEVDSRLTIKHQNGDIVTCNMINLPMEYNIKGELVYQTCITNILNLIKQ